MKYYVESGNLKTIVDCNDSFLACVKAVIRAIDKCRNDLGILELADEFFVSEKGFLSTREPFSVEIHMEKIYNTEILLDYIQGMPP